MRSVSLSTTQIQTALGMYDSGDRIVDIASYFKISPGWMSSIIGRHIQDYMSWYRHVPSDLTMEERIKEVKAHRDNMEEASKFYEGDELKKIMNEIMCCEDFLINTLELEL